MKIFIIFVKLNVNIQIMKKIISFLFTILLFQFSYTQLQSPVASPRAKVSQKVGLVNINLDYSRPSKKGRTIFGNIVPFDQIWRTGANQATSISFSDDVKINNQLVEAGEYHVYSVPRENSLDLVIYKKTDAWGSLKSFDESLIKARVTSDFYDLPFSIETFTISFGDISNAGASLNISWDNKVAIYVIDALTREKMLNSIEETMAKNPTKNDFRKAAMYYYEENIHIDKAVKWIDIAFDDSDDLKYWQLRYKALINEKAGKIKKAKKYAKKGYEIALKSKSPDAINTLKILNDRLNN
ncbi:MAG: dihydrolipoamide dehydrogenase [Flavobacteriaceae bacterium]|nr:dihydrolipoamide dehydrogenase [Flavobacteriaceae bacterium]